MKKILYIANIRLPTEKAHGLQIMKTCEALARQGIEVELIIPKRFNTFKNDQFAFYNVVNNFKIIKVWCLDLISLNIFDKLGFWIESYTFYRSIKNYLRGQSEAVYYTRDISIAYWLSKIVSQVYYEIHTLPIKLSRCHYEAWERAAGLVVISEGLKQELVRRGVSQEKILVARDSVDARQFKINESLEECRKKLNLSLNQKIVVYTGHLYKWKGVDILVEAGKFLLPDIHIYIVGGTIKDLKKIRQKYHSPNVHIVGWQEHSLIPYWDKAADVIVLPNSAKEKIGALYTSPLKLFEYMASGTPMVISDLPAMREVVKEGEVVFFRPDDNNGLAVAIRFVFENRSYCREVAKNLQENVAQYSWETRATLIKNFIFYNHE